MSDFAELVTLPSLSCSRPKSCFAVGTYALVTGDRHIIQRAFLLRWDGQRWLRMAGAKLPDGSAVQLNTVSCSGPDHCLAVGVQFQPSGPGGILNERWDGHHWSVVDDGDRSLSFIPSGLACRSSVSCYAVGSGFSIEGPGTAVAHWNGRTWSAVSSAQLKRATIAGLEGIDCPTRTACYAAGFFRDQARIVHTRDAGDLMSHHRKRLRFRGARRARRDAGGSGRCGRRVGRRRDRQHPAGRARPAGAGPRGADRHSRPLAADRIRRRRRAVTSDRARRAPARPLRPGVAALPAVARARRVPTAVRPRRRPRGRGRELAAPRRLRRHERRRRAGRGAHDGGPRRRRAARVVRPVASARRHRGLRGRPSAARAPRDRRRRRRDRRPLRRHASRAAPRGRCDARLRIVVRVASGHRDLRAFHSAAGQPAPGLDDPADRCRATESRGCTQPGCAARTKPSRSTSSHPTPRPT